MTEQRAIFLNLCRHLAPYTVGVYVLDISSRKDNFFVGWKLSSGGRYFYKVAILPLQGKLTRYFNPFSILTITAPFQLLVTAI